ncbi:GPR endopeptidase [Clostridium gasigenes]|uniref:Germination protease n=1 Tax=Clostridium gasigenes TaxID=94869 RepID=A0A1H0TVD7_9CLOT|nr:GPR endopeptidase [Clostridium gasigenes]MBB6624282.1 GPR endopeptidase [Clostridium gasigenes]MBB6714670.1 GPR endopeptidase [Clostridium gasigenes]MBU3089263.1 GPR endopeptidase [Clostridium gasigenes]MBU3105258.1 GPR endopeptidase [Clostridium gasigenes]MBU3109391.1 GPR endopeptidase [Clostridium gasigenes]
MINVRTDLAIEAREMYKRDNKSEIDGVIVEEEKDGEIKISTVTIETDEAGEKIGKPKGNYITIDFPEYTHYDGESMDKVSYVVSNVLKRMVSMPDEKTVLVVGLGNWNVTPDALGPKVSEKIMVTRHLKEVMPDVIDDSVRSVCTIAPGVLGITGIETGEVIKSLVNKIKPDLVICVDALGSRKLERVNRTIQIGDTGISPGAGVGNHRMKINEETLGVKVIAIGVPTVVDAATMANDTIDLLLDELIGKAEEGKEFYNMLKSIDKNEKSALIKEVLNPFIGDLMVTPKDIDTIVNSLAKIIANGINMAIQPNLDMEDINKFMN